MSDIQEYDPKDVSCQAGGVILDGFAEGTFIVITPDEDQSTKKVGADGAVLRSLNANEGASVEITFLHGSSGAAILDAYRISRAAFPFSVFDPSTGSMHATEAAWIKTKPARSYGKEGENLSYTLDIGCLREAHNPATLL